MVVGAIPVTFRGSISAILRKSDNLYTLMLKVDMAGSMRRRDVWSGASHCDVMVAVSGASRYNSF